MAVKCDLDGCKIEARWIRISTTSPGLQELLCADHWRDLHRAAWGAASSYSPLRIASPKLSLKPPGETSKLTESKSKSISKAR
jgi:hypothetical protein